MKDGIDVYTLKNIREMKQLDGNKQLCFVSQVKEMVRRLQVVIDNDMSVADDLTSCEIAENEVRKEISEYIDKTFEDVTQNNTKTHGDKE